MIAYKKCIEVDINHVYDAFRIGFSDYMIHQDISLELFAKRFFGPEGNKLDLSFIAFDDNEPIGLILGGMKEYEGIRTLRCGALCINPIYRGKGISKKLFDLHQEAAIENGCKQLFLEVIVGNDRAIKFYRNLGYEKIYDLSYFSHENPSMITMPYLQPNRIEELNMESLRALQPEVYNIHINWQNDFDYLDYLNEVVHYGIYNDKELVGALSILKSGKISFLWIRPSYRGVGIGRVLLGHAVKKLSLTKITINFPNNAGLEGFIKHLGFKRDAISQYEMYRTL